MGADKNSAGGQNYLLQGGGLLLKSRVWVGRGKEKKYLSWLAFFGIFPQKTEKVETHTVHFFMVFDGTGRGKPWKFQVFLDWGGVKFCPRGGGLCFDGSAYGHPPPYPSPFPYTTIHLVRPEILIVETVSLTHTAPRPPCQSRRSRSPRSGPPATRPTPAPRPTRRAAWPASSWGGRWRRTRSAAGSSPRSGSRRWKAERKNWRNDLNF